MQAVKASEAAALSLAAIALFLSVFVLITLILFFADLIFAKVGTSNMIT